MSPLPRLALVLLLFTSYLQAQSPHPSDNSDERRLFGIGPRFDITQRDNPRSLTSPEKFRLFAADATRPYLFITAAGVSGISMLTPENRGFGQGGAGFAKRFGAALADGTSTAFFGEFVFPSLFRQDPRYFRQETSTKSQRLGYAISRVVVTRSDTGRQQFNVSKILGIMCSGALANTYYPESQRSVGRTFETIGINFGTSAGLNVVKEFWPRRKKR